MAFGLEYLLADVVEMRDLVFDLFEYVLMGILEQKGL
jgi:hypothetical protein